MGDNELKSIIKLLATDGKPQYFLCFLGIEPTLEKGLGICLAYNDVQRLVEPQIRRHFFRSIKTTKVY
jgi:hypothetical protein